MKINVEFDLTPVEFREIFGLPDVRPVQKEMMDKIREKMLASVENYDPMNFLAPYLSENMQSMEHLPRAMWEGLAAGAKPKQEQ